MVHGLTNFRKMGEYELIRLHPAKYSDFQRGLKGFVREEFRKGEGKFLILGLLADGSHLKAKEIAKKINRVRATVVDEHLTPMRKAGLVENEQKGRIVFWKITELGRKILNHNDAMDKLKQRKTDFTLL